MKTTKCLKCGKEHKEEFVIIRKPLTFYCDNCTFITRNSYKLKRDCFKRMTEEYIDPYVFNYLDGLSYLYDKFSDTLNIKDADRLIDHILYGIDSVNPHVYHMIMARHSLLFFNIKENLDRLSNKNLFTDDSSPF